LDSRAQVAELNQMNSALATQLAVSRAEAQRLRLLMSARGSAEAALTHLSPTPALLAYGPQPPWPAKPFRAPATAFEETSFAQHGLAHTGWPAPARTMYGDPPTAFAFTPSVAEQIPLGPPPLFGTGVQDSVV
jgi:hypothetical protein